VLPGLVAGTGASGAAAGWAARPPDGLWITVLGPLAAHRDGQPLDLGPARQQAVLGVLALHACNLVHRDTIIAAVWGQAAPPSAVKMVQSYVSGLRRVLDPGRPPRARDGLLVSAGTSYCLNPRRGQLDLAVFGELAGQAAAARLAGDLAGACGWFAAALATWQGEALSGLDVLHDWPDRRDPHRLWAEVTGQFADTAASAGRPELALPYLRILTDGDQLNERAHARLMIALAGAGQQAAALRVHHELRQRLDEQLGIRPCAELAGAYERVLRQDVAGDRQQPAWLPAAG
jgi:DNA-binding SARP family transcriptional activator